MAWRARHARPQVGFAALDPSCEAVKEFVFASQPLQKVRCANRETTSGRPCSGDIVGAPGRPDSFTPSTVRALFGHDDRRVIVDTAVQIGDVLVVHANTAVGDEAADRRGAVGAVNGVLAS